MKILNLKETQQISGGDYTVEISLDIAGSPATLTQSQAVANALTALLSSNPFDITTYVDALAAAGLPESSEVSTITLNYHV